VKNPYQALYDAAWDSKQANPNNANIQRLWKSIELLWNEWEDVYE
jgi:predicted metal-dependent hydrolase